MRSCIGILLVLACGLLSPAQGVKFTRYNIDYDSISYAQDTPKQALASVLRALNEGRVDYMPAPWGRQLYQPAPKGPAWVSLLEEVTCRISPLTSAAIPSPGPPRACAPP